MAIARLGDHLDVAFAGTLLVLANIATEAFAMPAAPEPLSDPKGYWLFVIILSFGMFSLGWLLTGVAALRAGVVGRGAGLLLCAGAVVAFTPVQGAYILLLAGAAATAMSLGATRRATAPLPA